MKKAKLLLYMLCVFIYTGKAQTPYNDTLNLTGNVNIGTYTNTPNNDNASQVNSNQQIGGIANITYLAGEEIYLTDSFVANPNQDFDARIKKVDVADMSKNNHSWNPKKYERFEIGVQVMPDIQSQINAFLSTGNPGANKLNPYDPEQVKIKAEFKHNDTTYVRYGFYYKEFKQQANYLDWDNVLPSPYTFRVRLAPPATGAWTFTMHLIVNNIDISQFRGSFNVQSGTDNDGFLTIDNTLRRFKFQESGNAFFGIGEDIADADWRVRHGGPPPTGWCDGTCVSDPYSYNEQRSYISNLDSNGGNFVRIRLDPWSNPVESHDVHQFPLSDDSTLTLTLSQCINNYDHNQRHLWEFDSTLALCESKGLYIMLNFMQNGYFGGIPGDSTNHDEPKWHNNPYAALLNDKTVDGVRAFFTDTTAMNYYKKQLFYIQARWGYSTHIALWEYVNETIYLGDGLYQSDVPFRANVDAWICYMRNYMETGEGGQSFYPRHPHTTGHPLTNGHWGPQCLDVYSINDYSNAQSTNMGRNGTVETHWNNNQSFLYGEVGFDPECAYVDVSSDVEFHNAVWAGTFSGALSTPLYWNDWHQHYIPHRQNFVGLKAFTDLIDFNQTLIPSHTANGNVGYDTRLSSVSGPTIAYGWAQNASHYWHSDVSAMDTLKFIYDLYQYAVSISSPNLPRKYCDTANYPYPMSPVACNYVYNFPINFGQMPAGNYQIDYYNTQTGAHISSNSASNWMGGVTIPLVFYHNFGCSTDADVAYIVQVLQYFGNNRIMAASDTTTNSDSLAILKADTNIFKPMRVMPNSVKKNNMVMVKNQIKIFPNPARDFVRIVNESGAAIDKCSLYDLLGKAQAVELNNNQSIDISHIAAGAYLLHISSGGYETVFRIIKTY